MKLCERRNFVIARGTLRRNDQAPGDLIRQRIARLRLGNFGDTRPVGDGVHELRIHFGPGFRVYFGREGDAVVILLCGGDKGSQRRDIAKAIALAALIKE